MAVAGLGPSGCAQISTSRRTEVRAIPGAKAVFLGSERGQITARSTEVQWRQKGGAVEVDVVELRQCRLLQHRPVKQIEYTKRKPDQAIYWEYGLAAASIGVGIAALVVPESFSPRTIDTSTGEVVPRTNVGLGLGGAFTALGALLLGGGIYDTVRSRDTVDENDAYEVVLGESAPCDVPQERVAGQTVAVLIGAWSIQGTTDRAGRVRVSLPTLDELAAIRSGGEGSPDEADEAEAAEADNTEAPGVESATEDASREVGAAKTKPLSLGLRGGAPTEPSLDDAGKGSAKGEAPDRDDSGKGEAPGGARKGDGADKGGASGGARKGEGAGQGGASGGDEPSDEGRRKGEGEGAGKGGASRGDEPSDEPGQTEAADATGEVTETERVAAFLRIGSQTLPFEFVIPYDDPAVAENEGGAVLRP